MAAPRAGAGLVRPTPGPRAPASRNPRGLALLTCEMGLLAAPPPGEEGVNAEAPARGARCGTSAELPGGAGGGATQGQVP